MMFDFKCQLYGRFLATDCPARIGCQVQAIPARQAGDGCRAASMGERGFRSQFRNLAEPVVERAACVGVSQAGSPTDDRTGGADCISGSDDVVHKIEGQRIHGAGGANKMVFVGFPQE